MTSSARLVLIALALGACAPRSDSPHGPNPHEPHLGHTSVMLEPPFTIVVTPRDRSLDVHVTTRRALAGELELVLDESGHTLARRLAARTTTTHLPRARTGPWTITARWQHPDAVAGATTIVSSEPEPAPAPHFVPIVPATLGALRIDSAVPVRPSRP